jgi:hypothetical protein
LAEYEAGRCLLYCPVNKVVYLAPVEQRSFSNVASARADARVRDGLSSVLAIVFVVVVAPCSGADAASSFGLGRRGACVT